MLDELQLQLSMRMDLAKFMIDFTILSSMNIQLFAD